MKYKYYPQCVMNIWTKLGTVLGVSCCSQAVLWLWTELSAVKGWIRNWSRFLHSHVFWVTLWLAQRGAHGEEAHTGRVHAVWMKRLQPQVSEHLPPKVSPSPELITTDVSSLRSPPGHRTLSVLFMKFLSLFTLHWSPTNSPLTRWLPHLLLMVKSDLEF